MSAKNFKPAWGEMTGQRKPVNHYRFLSDEELLSITNDTEESLKGLYEELYNRKLLTKWNISRENFEVGQF